MIDEKELPVNKLGNAKMVDDKELRVNKLLGGHANVVGKKELWVNKLGEHTKMVGGT